MRKPPFSRPRIGMRQSVVPILLLAAVLGLSGCSPSSGEPSVSSAAGGPQTAPAASGRQEGAQAPGPAARPGSGGPGSGAGTGGGPQGGGAGTPGAGVRGNGAPPVATAAEQTRSRSIQVGGRLEPRTRIVHTIPVAGLVRSIPVRPGTRVRQGETLLTVERNEIGQVFRPVPLPARIDGIVAEVTVQTDEEVRAGDPAVTLIGTGGFTLEARISDKDAFRVSPDQAVTAHTPDGTMLQGRLAVRSQEPDYQTGLFSLTFEFPASRDAFVGQFLLVQLPTETRRSIFVPREAVDRRYGRFFVWVIDPQDQVLRRREVTLGDPIGDEIPVVSGLASGERYLTRLTGREREGAPAPGSR